MEGTVSYERLINYLDQNPSEETDSRSSGQEILRLSCNLLPCSQESSIGAYYKI
jgi:hypothetical protein